MTTRRPRAQWEALVQEQANSGLSQKAFCQQAGISVSAFGYWKRKLRAQSDAASAASNDRLSLNDWLELSTPADKPVMETGSAADSDAVSGLDQVDTPSPPWRVELDLGDGICLRLR